MTCVGNKQVTYQHSLTLERYGLHDDWSLELPDNHRLRSIGLSDKYFMNRLKSVVKENQASDSNTFDQLHIQA